MKAHRTSPLLRCDDKAARGFPQAFPSLSGWGLSFGTVQATPITDNRQPTTDNSASPPELPMNLRSRSPEGPAPGDHHAGGDGHNQNREQFQRVPDRLQIDGVDSGAQRTAAHQVSHETNAVPDQPGRVLESAPDAEAEERSEERNADPGIDGRVANNR